MAAPPFTEPQRRRVAAILSEVEGAVNEGTRLLRQAGGLDPVARREAGAELDRLGEETRHAMAALGIVPQQVPRARRLRSLLLAQRVRLLDCYAAKLGGYGTVDPALADLLDPWIDSLLDHLDGAYRLIAPDHDTAAEESA